MAAIAMATMDLARFTYDRDRQSLVAIASDFGPLRDGLWWLNRMYDDAADAGIAIRSHKTGKVERFYLERTEERDGDLMAWHFRPESPGCIVKSVTIFND